MAQWKRKGKVILIVAGRYRVAFGNVVSWIERCDLLELCRCCDLNR